MSAAPGFDKTLSLKYLELPQDYSPSPETDPIAFLRQHLAHLPPHILLHYSFVTSPKQRTAVPAIRNRRLQHTNKNPSELQFESARRTWPNLWVNRERRGRKEAEEERVWVESDFLQGGKQHVGKLGDLLADYEEEREAQRTRDLWRKAPAEDDFVPEEDTDSDDNNDAPTMPERETEEEAQKWFERLIREHFIYGLLDNIEYDKVDWDETLDADDERNVEERWFDDEDES